MKEETCKHDIVFAEGAEYCVTLDGVLFAGNLVGHILFKKSDRICAVAAASKLEGVCTAVRRIKEIPRLPPGVGLRNVSKCLDKGAQSKA